MSTETPTIHPKEAAPTIIFTLKPGEHIHISGRHALYRVSKSVDGKYYNVTRHHNASGVVTRRRYRWLHRVIMDVHEP